MEVELLPWVQDKNSIHAIAWGPGLALSGQTVRESLIFVMVTFLLPVMKRMAKGN